MDVPGMGGIHEDVLCLAVARLLNARRTGLELLDVEGAAIAADRKQVLVRDEDE